MATRPRRQGDGGPAGRGDLSSHLLFEPAFMDAAIRLGRRDGQAILDRPPLWKEVEFPPG
jgi:hypothetical protein